MFTKCTFARSVKNLQVQTYFNTTMLTFDVQVSFNLLKHEMQLSGAISI